MTIQRVPDNPDAIHVYRDIPTATEFRYLTERGLSAYEIAVRNGYEGTEAQWIQHLQYVLTGIFPEPIIILPPVDDLNPTTKLYVDTADAAINVAIAAVVASLDDYYTKVELDAGQLDNRYYTETEIDTILAGYVTDVELATALGSYYTSAEVDLILAGYTTDAELASALTSYYTAAQVDTLLGSYATDAEVATALAGKSDVGHTHAYAALSHTHVAADITDLGSFTGFDARYYTESEVDTLLGGYTTDAELAAALADYDLSTEVDTKIAASTIYDILAFIGGKPTDEELVFRMVAARAFTIPSGATGSRATAAVAATGTKVFSLAKNGTEFGTVTFTASATGVFSVASATSFVAGDVLTIIAPATADTTLEDISFSLAGDR